MNPDLRLAVAAGLVASTAAAAIGLGLFLLAPAPAAKPLAPIPVFDQRRFNDAVTAAQQSRDLQQMRPCCLPGDTMPTAEERKESKRKADEWKRQHDEDLKRLKARPLDPTGNRVPPRPRWEWNQT